MRNMFFCHAEFLFLKRLEIELPFCEFQFFIHSLCWDSSYNENILSMDCINFGYIFIAANLINVDYVFFASWPSHFTGTDMMS